MKQFPSNLSADDLRTHRRWTGGLYMSYLAAILVAINIYQRCGGSHACRKAVSRRGPATQINIHFFGNSVMIKPFIRLLMITAMLATCSAFAGTEQTRVQFCWAKGRFDHTVYYADIENREDRQASFDELLEISGIDHDAVKCSTSDSATHRTARTKLLKDWLQSEFEIVNTTFLSDLDY